MPASKYKHEDEFEAYGHRFRIRRIRGFKALSAKAAWVRAVGEGGAHLMAVGAERVGAMAEKVMDDEQREAMETVAEGDQSRFLAILAIMQQVRRATLTPESQADLVAWFVLGWVDVEIGGDWIVIETTDTLDKHLDGESDGDVWARLLYRQIPHCLGPSMPATGTASDSPATGQT